MLKAAIACGLLLLGTIPASAQVPGLGVKGGVNLATQRAAGDGGSGELKSLVGLTAGMFATIPMAGWLELQPEALYARKGARVELEGVTADLLIDYLEVPVLVRASKRRAGALGYYVAGGPSFAVQLRARTRTDFGSATEEIDLGDQVERLDFGATIGGGVEIGSLVVDGRYTHGFKDVDTDTSDGVKVTNRTVSITVGFRF